MCNSNTYLNEIQTISLPNKYTNWYCNIIQAALLRSSSKKEAKKLLGYVEGHHILPKSFKLGGEKDKTNIAFLTAKEHFICHILLTKMLPKGEFNKKMWLALNRLMNSRNNTIISSNHYKILRENHSRVVSILCRGTINKGTNGKTYDEIYGDRADEMRAKRSKSNSERVWTEESKKQMSISKTGQGKGLKLGPMPKSQKDNLSKSKSSKEIYTWSHKIYGAISCTRYELKQKFPNLNFKNSELTKVIKGEYRHRGWSIIHSDQP
jgi:hypothetical protein